MKSLNNLGIQGLAFVELSTSKPDALADLLGQLGFAQTMSHGIREIDLFQQNQINILLNREPGSHADGFQCEFGAGVASLGWIVEDPERALTLAMKRGAEPVPGDYVTLDGDLAPCIQGIGESLHYFIQKPKDLNLFENIEFETFGSSTQSSQSVGLNSIRSLCFQCSPPDFATTVNFFRRILDFQTDETTSSQGNTLEIPGGLKIEVQPFTAQLNALSAEGGTIHLFKGLSKIALSVTERNEVLNRFENNPDLNQLIDWQRSRTGQDSGPTVLRLQPAKPLGALSVEITL